jgi:microcompartment protein CcmK/EutM
MLLARVDGHVVATHKHPTLVGQRLLLCQPITADGRAEGSPVAAIDPWGAALHQRVIVSTDGAAARRFVGDPRSPSRLMIVGIVDPEEAAP